jgi:phosphate transport system permease protein
VTVLAPPRRRSVGPSDQLYRWGLRLVAGVFAALLGALLISLIIKAKPALGHNGVGFLTQTRYDPNHAHYGVLSMIVGTLETTVIALVIAVPLGLAVAIALVEYVPPRIAAVLGAMVELLAAVPSVVFGLWGLLVISPWFSHTFEPWLKDAFGWTGLLNGQPIGVGLLLAGLILAIMILPTMASISRDVVASVPATTTEAATGLGATRWQTIARITVPISRPGLLGAIVLAAGRALGETIAVTMVIGNTNAVAHSLLGPSQTLASLIANEFTEATEPFHLATLIEAGLLLLLISAMVNTGARLLVRAVGRQSTGTAVL